MNMYIAQATDGSLKVVKSLGAIDPNERSLPAHAVRAAGDLTMTQSGFGRFRIGSARNTAE